MELKSGPCEDGSPPASTSGTPSVDGSLESTPTDLQQSISSQASSTVDFFETADESHPLSNTGSDDDDHESLSLAASITNTTTKSISPVSQRSIFRPPSDRTSAPQSITSSAASPLHKSLASPITRPAEQSSDPRSALFDDHVASAHVPGSLHLAPDSAIEKLVERQGIIPLIRQLASDLAHRDKELVSIRRRAEERERALKKMLVEVEVSNADIEKRLAAATVQRKPSKETIRSAAGDTSYTESIDDMMQQAMSEEDVFSVVDDSLSMMEATTDLGDDDRHSTRDDMITPKATLRARSDSRSILFERDTDSMSIISNASSRRGSTIRGWKSFFWGQRIGEGDEKSVGNERLILQNPPPGKRRGITNETFSPPPEGKPRILSRASSRSSLVPPNSARSTSLQITSTVRRTASPSSLYTFPHFASDQSHPTPPHFRAVGAAVSMIQPGSSPDALVQRGTSNAVAAWAMRLVSHAPPLHDQENFNPKSPMQPRSASATEGLRLPTDRRASSGSIDRENLQRIMAKNAVRTQTSPRRRTASTASNGAPPKSSKFFQDIMDHAERIVPLGNTQNASSADPSSGPVEMDRIVPHAIQPPTLLQSWNDYYPTDYLTDRFGFIYDKKNKAPSAKSMSSVESGDAKKPQYEDAKSGSTPNEGESSNASNGADDALLDAGDTRTPTRWQELPSEMPSTSLHQSKTSKEAPAKAVDNFQYGQPAKSLIDRIAKSTSAMASPTTTTFSEAPLALRSPLHSEMPSIAEASTVRLLLGQLSDLHDSLQRDRGAKWNEFLKKIRQERRRGEEEEKGMPEVLMGDGELIGIATLGNEGRGGKQRWKEFKSLVLGGIPVAYRWKVWTECSGATAMRVPGYYEDILENGLDDPLVISQIEMDINRTLTDNVFYRQGPGVSKLKQVLVAYSRRNSAVGYCQGMNMIAASLLLIMPSEEDAFWVLCSIVEKILPKTYFETNLLASRADQQVLKQYVQEALPSLHMHLQKLGVELEALTFQWFLSIFTDCLAAEALFRIWDVILCLVGSPFLFQVALALLRLNEKALISCKSAAAVYSYLNGEMTHQGISIDGLIRESDGMKHHVRRKEVELRRERAVEKELGEMGAEDNGNAAAEAVKTDSPIHVVANSSDEESREPSTKSIHDEEREDSKDQDGTKGEAAGVAEAEPSSCVIQEETAEELLADDAEPVVKTIEPVTNEDQKPETMPSPPPDKLITSIPPTEASAIPIVATT